jgi:hypothetical protein
MTLATVYINMNMKHTCYTLIVFLLCYSHTYAQNSNLQTPNYKQSNNKLQANLSISVVKNTKNGTAKLYMLSGIIKTDSIFLFNLDFKVDSIINHENRYWEYIFSTNSKRTHTSEDNNWRFLFTAMGSKLVFSFVSIVSSKAKIEDSDTNKYRKGNDSVLNILKKKYSNYNAVKLNFNKGKYSAEELYLCANCLYDVGGYQELRKKHIFKLDKNSKLFYSEKKMLNTKFYYSSSRNSKDSLISYNNKQAYFLNFYWYKFVNIDSVWYWYIKGRTYDLLTPLEDIYIR